MSADVTGLTDLAKLDLFTHGYDNNSVYRVALFDDTAKIDPTLAFYYPQAGELPTARGYVRGGVYLGRDTTPSYTTDHMSPVGNSGVSADGAHFIPGTPPYPTAIGMRFGTDAVWLEATFTAYQAVIYVESYYSYKDAGPKPIVAVINFGGPVTADGTFTIKLANNTLDSCCIGFRDGSTKSYITPYGKVCSMLDSTHPRKIVAADAITAMDVALLTDKFAPNLSTEIHVTNEVSGGGYGRASIGTSTHRTSIVPTSDLKIPRANSTFRLDQHFSGAWEVNVEFTAAASGGFSASYAAIVNATGGPSNNIMLSVFDFGKQITIQDGGTLALTLIMTWL